MSHTETIEQELQQYLEDSENLSRQDKFKYLKAIFDKHFEMEKTEHLITMTDFQNIISSAKWQMQQISLPATISSREVYPSEVPHIAMVESTISHLNRNKVLNKYVKIDITTKVK